MIESEKIILCDMDGVIVNFIQGMIDSHGLTISHDQYETWDYHRELGINDEEFWAPTLTTTWWSCLLYTSPSPRDGLLSRMPSSA